jgi:hypothetical protein
MLSESLVYDVAPLPCWKALTRIQVIAEQKIISGEESYGLVQSTFGDGAVLTRNSLTLVIPKPVLSLRNAIAADRATADPSREMPRFGITTLVIVHTA